MGSSSRIVDYISSETQHFCKIMNEDILRAGKLGIPRKFVRRYGSKLLNVVILRVPSGAVWHVALLKKDGDVWLHHGWREFADYYSLDCGHLVLFQLEGCDKFDVLIFDKSATEIQYPFSHVFCNEEPQCDGEHETSETEKSEDDDSVQILEDFTTSREARKREIVKSPHPSKKMKMRNNYSPRSRKEFRGGGMSTGCRKEKAGVVDRPRALTSSEKAEAFKRASDFQSANPYILIAMQPRYVLGKYELAIPIEFARKHLQIKHGKVILRVSNGRTWSAIYNYYPNLARPKAAISVGWKEFVCDNSLKLGDVCVFELNRTNCGITLNVFIF